MAQRFLFLFVITALCMPLFMTARTVPVGIVAVGSVAGREVWYVDPKSQKRFCLQEGKDVRAAIQSAGILVRHKDLVKIPKVGQRLRGYAKLQKKHAGRILLDRDRQNNAWYVHPVSRVRYPLYTKGAVKKTIASQAHAISPVALHRFSIGLACTPAMVVRMEPSPQPPVAVIGEPTVTPLASPLPTPASIPTIVPTITPLPLPSATPTPSPSTEPSCVPSTTELLAPDVLCLINRRRSSSAAIFLTAQDALTRVSTRYAEIIRARSDFRTAASSEPTIDSLFTDAGYAYGAYSAFFGIGHKTAEQVVTAIVGSDTNTAPSHLEPDYRDIGVGVVLRSGDKPTVWAVIIAQSKAAREAQHVFEKEAAAARTFVDPEAVIREIVERTNAARLACAPPECPTPLQPLTIAPFINVAAQGHADDMKARAFYSHENPSGESVGDRVTRAGYTWSTVAENIACGQETAQIVVDGWLKSPGHRHNIMNADITEIGIGFSYGRNLPCGNEQQLFTIYWAQNFARPR